jgi:transcriptional regulator with XRE-family HTH domain
LETLRYWRRARGLSQVDLAAKAHMSQHTVTSLENGKQRPQPKTLRKLSEALNVPIEDLLDEPAPKGEAPSPDEDGRRENVEIPLSMRALLWDRLSILPLIPLPHSAFVKVFESAESDEERERLYEQVQREREEVERYADELRGKLTEGARINPVRLKKVTEIWTRAAREQERLASELAAPKVKV